MHRSFWNLLGGIAFCSRHRLLCYFRCAELWHVHGNAKKKQKTEATPTVKRYVPKLTWKLEWKTEEIYQWTSEAWRAFWKSSIAQDQMGQFEMEHGDIHNILKRHMYCIISKKPPKTFFGRPPIIEWLHHLDKHCLKSLIDRCPKSPSGSSWIPCPLAQYSCLTAVSLVVLRTWIADELVTPRHC